MGWEAEIAKKLISAGCWCGGAYLSYLILRGGVPELPIDKVFAEGGFAIICRRSRSREFWYETGLSLSTKPMSNAPNAKLNTSMKPKTPHTKPNLKPETPKPEHDVDDALREVAMAVVAGDSAAVKRLLAAGRNLETAAFQGGATREAAQEWFVEGVRRYIVSGDTALHFAAAVYPTEIARMLVTRGAMVRARNRFGDEPLHSACAGIPGSQFWNPEAQSGTIRFLIEAGADPNAVNKRGVSPLHVAVRTRCAAAVRTLLALGADPGRTNKNGSTPMLLAGLTTGRGGSGSAEAKAQQREILELLEGPVRMI
jgi:Ankyrin repeats (many copies)